MPVIACFCSAETSAKWCCSWAGDLDWWFGIPGIFTRWLEKIQTRIMYPQLHMIVFFIFTYFIFGKSKLRILYASSKKFSNWQWSWDGDTPNLITLVFHGSIPHIFVFFSLVLPQFWGHAISDPAGTKEEQEMREAEQTRLQKAGPTGNTIADLVKNRNKREDPGGLWYCFGKMIDFGNLRWLPSMVGHVSLQRCIFLKTYYNLDLAPAGHCISSATYTYTHTQWYCFFYKKCVDTI